MARSLASLAGDVVSTVAFVADDTRPLVGAWLETREGDASEGDHYDPLNHLPFAPEWSATVAAGYFDAEYGEQVPPGYDTQGELVWHADRIWINFAEPVDQPNLNEPGAGFGWWGRTASQLDLAEWAPEVGDYMGGYRAGFRVVHKKRRGQPIVWESDTDDNVTEPGEPRATWTEEPEGTTS